MSAGRSGMTLIEILVVVSIIGLILAISLPALQASRDFSRRLACQNNLKQVGIALQEHVGIRSAFPPLCEGEFLPQPRLATDEFHFHSWRTAILGQIEQAALHSAINFQLPATVPANQTALNVRLATFVCPATSQPGRLVPEIAEWDGTLFPKSHTATAAPSDYEAMGGVQVVRQTRSSTDLSPIEFGAWGEPTYDLANGAALRYRVARLADVTDGLATTILVAERAGRPDEYQRGQLIRSFTSQDSPPLMDHH